MLLLNQTKNVSGACHEFGGITQANLWFQPGALQSFWYGEHTVSGETNKSAFPNGYTPPYSWNLSPKAGGISSINRISGTGDLSITSLSLGKALAADLTGSGDFASAPSLSMLIQLAADLLGSCTVSASLQASLNLAASLAGSGSVTSALSVIAFCVANLTGSGSVTGTFTGYANMSADLYVNQSEATAQQIAAAVWEALAADFNTAGTMGEKLNSAGGGSSPTDIADAVWTAGNIDAVAVAKIADIILRRTSANVEGSTNGDSLSLRSLYGMIAQGTNKTSISGSTLTVTKSDDVTTLGTRTITTDPNGSPISGIDTD